MSLLLHWTDYISNVSKQCMLLGLSLSPQRHVTPLDDLLNGVWHISDQPSVLARSDEVLHSNTRLICAFETVDWFGVELLLLWDCSKHRSIGLLMCYIKVTVINNGEPSG